MTGEAKREIILKLFGGYQLGLKNVFPTGEDAQVAIDAPAELDQASGFGGWKPGVEKRSGIPYLKTESLRRNPGGPGR